VIILRESTKNTVLSRPGCVLCVSEHSRVLRPHKRAKKTANKSRSRCCFSALKGGRTAGKAGEMEMRFVVGHNKTR
jgi:hypothetical protein